LGGGGGGRGGDGYLDALLAEGRRLAAMEREIGDGVALEVRRVSRRARGVVTVRALVDGLCLGGRTLAELLQLAGWPDNGATIAAARDAVAGALDRMGLV
jgi:hypothetical protein